MPGMNSTLATPVLHGIDVSHHQGNVNWLAVAEAGVSFAFAKATEGDTFADPQFSANLARNEERWYFPRCVPLLPTHKASRNASREFRKNGSRNCRRRLVPGP